MVHLPGRLDSQIAIGGLKVDLMAVERILAAIDGVRDAVVVHNHAIRAYVVLDGSRELTRVISAATRLLAPHQRPAVYHALPVLPTTPSGKRVRDPDRLAAAANPAPREVR